MKAIQLANFIINSQAKDEAEITPLKLQRLLYYCQGFFLAMYGKGLFADAIEAWEHGPVVRSVYEQYPNVQVLQPRDNYETDLGLKDDQMDLLTEVLSSYGRYSSWTLRELIKSEEPWQQAFKLGQNARIKPTTMIEFFKTQLVKR